MRLTLFNQLRHRLHSNIPAAGRMGLSSSTGRMSVQDVSYDQVCGIIKASESGEKAGVPVLIDVRPAAEIRASGGQIPTAHNIPRTSNVTFPH